MKRAGKYLGVLAAAWLAWSCNVLRYVPEDRALLQRNRVEIESHEHGKRRERVTEGDLTPYIQQRRNNHLLGINFYLGMYNITDTSKHNGWQRFWRDKVGEPPVIYDSVAAARSARQMVTYLLSRGYMNARVDDTVAYRKRRATVTYRVRENPPYTIARMEYQIDDNFLRGILLEDTLNSLVRVGQILDYPTLEAEQKRITERLQNMGYRDFNKAYIEYEADSSIGLPDSHEVSLKLHLRRRTVSIDDQGRPRLENHPIYRIGRIVVNTEYDPTKSAEEADALSWDTLVYNGIEIVFQRELELRENVLAEALRLSPNELYDHSSVLKSVDNLHNLSYSSNILFQDITDPDAPPVWVSRADAEGENATTRERLLLCQVQCTPAIRHNLTEEAEISTTADYYSAALALRYQNLNLLRGAEKFSVGVRGAYELMKNRGNHDAYELGVDLGLDIPRFLLPIRADKLTQFARQTTKVSLSYNLQRRPDYNRTLVSATFGYAWSLKNGAVFQINPLDINVVSVPWIDPDFLADIDNPYLRNSYTSQIIAGLSAGYYYQTNPNPKANSQAFRLNADVNGNLIDGLAHLWGSPTTINPGTPDQEDYYTLFGIRYAQYARMSAEWSARTVLNNETQLAWRFFIGGGIPYGNSKSLPFERLFFAGGSNSMRGWVVRSLGPGSVPTDPDATYPNQLGDFRLEANMEYRFRVASEFGMALFLDAGNIWMNAPGSDPEARFKFNSFYRQVALAGGLGFRYDFGFVLLRLDWGAKIHNPNVPQPERWNSGWSVGQTALNFAIGLPF